MAGASSQLIYLDTCFIIDWLSRNQARADSHDVGGLIAALCKGSLRGITSVITKLEVLECKTDPTMWQAWLRLQAQKNVQVQAGHRTH